MSETKTEYAITKPTIDASVIETVLVGGDLSKLSAAQRTNYYKAVCDSIGLNPLTKPFDYITLNNRLTLYARKDATDQLRAMHGVSITKLERERIEGLYVVTAYALRDGRQDSSIGAVNIDGIKGDALANAIMKAETKAKRRVTLSICGLGILDETELETIPSVQVYEPEIKKIAPQADKNGEIVRPFPPEELKRVIILAAEKKYAGAVVTGERKEVAAALKDAIGDDLRHEFQNFVTGHESLTNVSDAMVMSLYKWLEPVYSNETKEYAVNDMAWQELEAYVARAKPVLL